MSIAGTRSSQGDEYQLRIALHWTIRLLSDSAIEAVQAESTGIPGEELSVRIDDVVIIFTGGRRIHIQAKKNQPEHSTWSLRDRSLQEELLKARDQLESHPQAEVHFYSQTPFGDLHRLAETVRSFPDKAAFIAGAAGSVKGILTRFAKIVSRDESAALQLGARIFFGPAHTFEEWDRLNLSDLARVVPNPATARDVLERLLSSHQAKLRGAPFLLCKDDVVSALEAHGLYLTPPYSDAETITAFRTASAIGREWIRTVDGEHFTRSAVGAVLRAIDEGRRSVLLTDRPGGGKTCVLLDLADQVESDPGAVLLFIKADLFAEASSEEDLQRRGMPSDVVGRCARLAVHRRVVVIIDSLDVLSLHRSHGSLRLFLGLIDRLRTIDGLTVVAACRDFDLHYDPHLRGRTWGETVIIEPLDFDSQVAPLLARWNVAAGELTEEFRQLLQVPQHLRIFERVARSSASGLSNVTSAYHLYERYLQEIVAADPLLGAPAMAALACMAERLVERRTLTVARATLDGWLNEQAGPETDQLVRRLISQEVLSEPRPGTLSFSHQSLLDCLAVYGALSRSETLLEFIRSKLPVPFIRPTVRVFFFYLRAQDPSRFRQQVRATLHAESLAYHLRRLVAESLAEIVPEDDDWPLLRWLLRTHPDLFGRLLGAMRGDAWLQILTSHVLPLVRGEADLREQWLLPLASHLRTWVQAHPAAVVQIWRDALGDVLANSRERRSQLTWIILNSLDAADVWQTEGIRELLEAMLDERSEDHRYALGRAISSFVRSTDGGDDLLWRFLTPAGAPEPPHVDYDSGDRVTLGALRFNRHEIRDGLLETRLTESDWLLDRFMETVVPPHESRDQAGDDWSDDADGTRIRSGNLGSTSYRRRHSRGVLLRYESENFLLDVVEQALTTRAARDDAWWREHEPLLRMRPDLGLRYLLLQAYRANPMANADGVAAQLCDPELLRAGDLDHELGELTLAAYPYLPDDAQEQHQRLVLGLYHLAPEVEWRDGLAQKMYEFLLWVPRPFRLAETQEFLDEWEPRFGPGRPSPRLHISDLPEETLLTVDGLLQLSPEGLVRVARFLDAGVGTARMGEFEYGRGRHSLQRVLRGAAEVEPVRMLDLIDELSDAGVDDGYIDAVVDGVANHLRYRFGSLKPAGDWTPREPLPDGGALATRLLDLLDQYPVLWSFRSTASDVAEACAHVLLDEVGASRLTALLYDLSQRLAVPDSTSEHVESQSADDRSDRLLHEAINQPRGVAAIAAVNFCNHLIEHERPIPDLLIRTIHTFAGDPEPSTRTGVLRSLPFTVWARPEVGWPIVESVLRSDPEMPRATPPTLWRYLEPVLYYQYYQHFDRVAPLLNRLCLEALESAAETYGRISALSWLTGHITAEQIFEHLAGTPEGAWKGTAQVLCANVESAASRAECRRGLLQMLQREDVPAAAADQVAHAFSDKGPGAQFTAEIALALISARGEREAPTPGGDKSVRLSGVVDWVALESAKNPLSALGVVEALANVFEREGRMSLYNAGDLVTALSAVLREAEEMDDCELLLRVLAIQDKLLRQGLSEVDELLNRAARP
ncbi:MAG TPA: ATP-binding protein [Longimicrobiaceae bacterium]|nr:ATP-binding protein [Longimicrobiaceae bacterium]